MGDGDGALQGYRKLRTWQKADELASAVFKTVTPARTIPPWLASQVCRPAISVPASIAEGYSRGSLGDYLHFLDIARGSLAETDYYVAFMGKNNLLSTSGTAKLTLLAAETGKLLIALIKSLVEKQKTGTWERRNFVREDQERYVVEYLDSEEHFSEPMSGSSPAS